jgi:hypothetical protein
MRIALAGEVAVTGIAEGSESDAASSGAPAVNRRAADPSAPTGADTFPGSTSPHQAVLLAVAAREVGRDDADDLVQETLLRVWRRRTTYRPDLGTPRAWLIGILLDRSPARRARRSARVAGGVMNDDELDSRLQAWGAQARDAAGGAAEPQRIASGGPERIASGGPRKVPPTGRSTRRSRLLPLVAAAAAVATLVAGVGAAQLGSAAGNTAVHTSDSGDVHSPVIPADSTAPNPSHTIGGTRSSSPQDGASSRSAQLSSTRDAVTSSTTGGYTGRSTPTETRTVTGTDAVIGSAIASPEPAGLQRIVFHGLSIDVPADWPLNARQCATPIQDTVLLPGAVFDCMSPTHPAVTSVEFQDGPSNLLRDTLRHIHTSTTSVDGHAAIRLTGQDPDSLQPYVIAVNVPSLPAQVVIRSPQQATAEALADSLAIAEVDPNGCSSRDAQLGVLPTGLPSARPGADSTLVPGTPTDVTICRYEAGLLEQSTVLDDADRTSLVELLNGLPAGLSRLAPNSYSPDICRSPATDPGALTGTIAFDSEAYLIHVHYQSGPTLDVVVRLGRCGTLGASNGTRTGQLTMDMQRLMTMAGSTQGMPEQVQPAG